MNWYKIAQNTITLYHGTNSDAVKSMQRSKFIRPFNPQEVINEMVEDADIKSQLLEEQKLRDVINQARFESEGQGIYLTPSKEMARRYASPLGGELIQDVAHLTGKQLPESKPAILTIELPIDQLPPQYQDNIELMEVTGLPPEDIFEQIIINKPISAEHIRDIEIL